MLDRFLESCLLLDLETSPETGRLLKIGAVFRDRVLHRKGRFKLDEALAELERLAAPAARVLGHNLLDHDLPVLARLAPRLHLLHKPVVDTLFLSPLAFPENPYHRLVKDYKLVRQTVNNPVEDARLAERVFRDQWASFAHTATREPDLLRFYSYCLSQDRGGLCQVFDAIGPDGRARPMSSAEAAAWVERAFADRACKTALRRANQVSIAWAYAAAWLTVAGGNSVLPPWVRRRYPETVELLAELREAPCSDPSCSYCRETHDVGSQLTRFFGYDDFRAEPAGPDGESLQQRIVEHGLAGRPLLALLATGGGKSLCYQLPALIRYQRRGQLTIVVSPLQALMQDQVANLNARVATDCAAAINGLLTPPERGAVLERVRLGDVALLYVAPEQLRNRSFGDTVRQREIACWVFDEAHCLSKWGHDFRPDYLYAARFVRALAERQGAPCPPVACFTATAKLDVREEIRDYFRRELGQEVTVLSGGLERGELSFVVEEIHPAAKHERILELAGEVVGDRLSGAVVVYYASRRATEEAAQFLAGHGLPAAAFHAGLDPLEKRRVLEGFSAGSVPVVCATNAFGLGIDKEDVRLVLHADLPGSLESYLQEAGRAGRDRMPARCVLLFDGEDVERQLKLTAQGRLTRRDLAQILRGLRHRARAAEDKEFSVTAGEILADDAVDTSFDAAERDAEVRVRTAVSWLERAGFVERTENLTRAINGRLLVQGLDEAQARLAGKDLSPAVKERVLTMTAALINADPTRGLSVDELAETPGLDLAPATPEEPRGEQVLRLLQTMVDLGLLESGLQLSVLLDRRTASKAYEALCRLDRTLLSTLAEHDPEADDGSWRPLSLRLVNQLLLDQGLPSHPETLRRLLCGLAYEGKTTPGQAGSLELSYCSQHHYRLRLLRPWKELSELAAQRHATGRVVLDFLLSRAPAEAAGKLRVAFAFDEAVAALKRDLALGPLLDPLATAERTLLFLHEQGIVQLERGLAVFRQAMTLRVRPEAKGRRYTQGDFAPLAQHYDERIFQVHVMARYAKLGLEAIKGALALVADYFRLGKKSFLARHFAGEDEIVRRATSRESFKKIVDELVNPTQIALVAAPVEKNLLVLAGPGSGKTRVVVHRCAYLLRVARVPARGILVLCFNRNAALEVRRRLSALVGDDARGVTVQTYHGLAMRLTGTSFATAARAAGEPPDFDRLVPDAVRLLREGGGEDLLVPGHEELRDRLLAGVSHILVDEYQDINADQYELVSAIAGRTLADPDKKLALLAVGDDDQTIYDFAGANVTFIRRFQEDYTAEVHTLVECYRSSAHIVGAANRLIAANRDRLKTEHPIRVDSARRKDPPGGRFAALDPETQGRVDLLAVADEAVQAAAVAAEIARVRRLDPETSFKDFAVLARTRRVLEPIRAVLEHAGVPVAWTADRKQLPSLGRVREIAALLADLSAKKLEACRASELEAWCRARNPNGAAHPWWDLLLDILAEWREETGDERVDAASAAEFVQEALVAQRREPAFGAGVSLLTVHAAKGLEFRHVLLADGDWNEASEAERRLYYVGMTRARETLHLLSRKDLANPHLKLLAGSPDLCVRHPAVSPPPPQVLGRRFLVLGLADLYLSYAGGLDSRHRAHRVLSNLQPGDPLALRHRPDNGAVLLEASDVAVASLSSAGKKRLDGCLDRVESARVLAIVEWSADDTDAAYLDRLRCERWGVPVAEVGLGAG